MPVLLVIIGSTRPGRIGLSVGQWFAETARQHGRFEVAIADLAELNLPLMDEPHHPRLQKYTKVHTQQWSQMVDQADAVALVLPEYNYSMTAPVKNALDYLSREWKYKPAGLVSYGGASGGLRAAQMVKQVVTALGMMPLPESVSVAFAGQYVQDGVFAAPEPAVKAAAVMLDELVRWAEALKVLRESAAVPS